MLPSGSRAALRCAQKKTARNLTTTPKGNNFGRNFGKWFSLGVRTKCWVVGRTKVCAEVTHEAALEQSLEARKAANNYE